MYVYAIIENNELEHLIQVNNLIDLDTEDEKLIDNADICLEADSLDEIKEKIDESGYGYGNFDIFTEWVDEN